MTRGVQAALIAVVVVISAMAGHFAGRSMAPDAAPIATVPAREAVAALFALTLPDSAGTPHALAQWQGKIVVVNFWATWCPPCRDEIPAFAAVSRRLAGEQVQFIGLSLDSAENVQAFAQEFDVPYPLLIASYDVLGLVAATGNPSRALPFTLIVDRHGKIRHTELGSLNTAELEGKIHPLLAQDDPSPNTQR